MHPSKYLILNTGLTIVDREHNGDYGMPEWGDFAMVKVKEGADIPDLVTAGLFDEEWPRRRKAWGGGFGEPMVGAQAARFHLPVARLSLPDLFLDPVKRTACHRSSLKAQLGRGILGQRYGPVVSLVLYPHINVEPDSQFRVLQRAGGSQQRYL